MRARVRNLSIVMVFLLITLPHRVQAAITTGHLHNSTVALSVVNANGGAVRVTTEMRVGGRNDWELGLRRDPLVLNDSTSTTTNFDAWVSGVPIPFLLTYDGRNRATMTLVLSTVVNGPSFSVTNDFNEIFIPTRAVNANSSIAVGNLFLNGQPIAGSSSAVNTGTDTQDVLRIQGASLSKGFLLAGTITMRWTVGTRPKGSQLDAQIWLAKVITETQDSTPPIVNITAPTSGSLLNTATPHVAATFADSDTGIDPTSAQLALDDTDHTSQAQVNGTGLSFTPSTPLTDGAHTAEVKVRDHAGNLGQATVSFTTDNKNPLVTVTTPAGGTFLATNSPTIAATFSDSGSGVDPSSVRLLLDDGDVTGQAQVSASGLSFTSSSLADGAHTAQITLRDLAGNPGQAAVSFTSDTVAPTLAFTSPANDGSFVNTASLKVEGTVSDASPVVSVTVNGAQVSLVNGVFQSTVTLVEGINEILVSASDSAGNQGFSSRLVTLDTTPPQLVVKSPAPGQVVNSQDIQVSGQATDDQELAEVTVQGNTAPVSAELFETTVPVASGDNLITLRAVDRAGNESLASVTVTRFDLPDVTITSPPDLSFLATTTVEVIGTVSDSGAQVTVNGIPATVSGTTFTAREVPLIEGGNILTATATDAHGHVATGSINVVRDLTPPHLTVQYPPDGSAVFDSPVTVTGLVNDIVAGTVNAAQATVTVNGRAATVSNRSFIATGVPLSPGDNVISVVAADASGNTGEARATVHLETPSGPRISLTSGNLQEGVIGSALSGPLVVTLFDAAGQPVPRKTVLFKVRGNDGSLDGGRRQIAVVTDSSGQAAAHFTLGLRAGVGNQVVKASSVGFQGEAVFLATARPGPSTYLVVDSGDQQVGVAGRLLSRPLVAVVTDRGYNRLEGIAARFKVVKGQGQFQNALQEALTFSDSDGRLILPFQLDPEEGIANNVVEGRIDGQDAGPVVSFVASGRAAGDPTATSISGVVLDNASQPLAGVTLRVLDTALTARTNANGLFKISSAPVGTIKLIVDGSTVDRPGTWPDLEYTLTTIPGRDTTVNMPIYLLALDQHNGLLVDETHGGTLTLPEVPGFALEIAPGSVLFPGGSRSGVVSVTVAHNDRVPMVPNFGQQPRLIVTIQPAGARFDPPARLTLPNVEGLAPGAVTEMYSFDHDLGHFVSIGPATVSEDGSAVTSNLGVGVIKAGWHCCGNPAGTGTPNHCDLCYKCTGAACVPDDHAPCDDHNSCTANDTCRAGVCSGDRKRMFSVTATADGQEIKLVKAPGSAVLPLSASVSFAATAKAQNCDMVDYQWDFGDGQAGTGSAINHIYINPGRFMIKVVAACRGCEQERADSGVEVVIPFVEVTAADVTQDTIQVHLIPDGETGILRLELAEPDSDVIQPGIQLPGGTHSLSFNIPRLLSGEYSFVRGTWTVRQAPAQGERRYHIQVLGNWRHSQYNVPDESGCVGTPQSVFLSPGINQCFTGIAAPNASFLSDFASQTALNGTGISLNYGAVKAVAATSCESASKPPGSTHANTFVQVPNVTGSCNMSLSNTSLAACAGDARLPCGARIYIHTVGIKTVLDECPACCNNDQLDNFTLNAACRPRQIPDLGRFMTIRIFD